MTFALLPALDVVAGRVGGRALLDLALAWQAEGAEWLHLVDLDAARGVGSNGALLAEVVAGLDVPVQLSGGIHDDASLAWALSTGCRRAVLATDALRDPAWCERAVAAHGDRLAVALDVDGDRLRDRGTGRDAGEWRRVLAVLDRAGCARYVVTDVERDGNLRGPNLDLYRRVADVTTAPLTASGGVATLDDLRALAALTPGLDSAVVGRALLDGRFTVAEARAAVAEHH